MNSTPEAITRHTVAVRTLCDFTARAGDLDRRFVPAPTALQGMAGHALVASRRGPDYESEVSLGEVYKTLHVRGRADGYDPQANRVEEVKTYRGDLARMPANHRALHWAQACVYGHLLCVARGLSAIDVALIYFDIGTQTETVLVQHHGAQVLAERFADQCERYLAWGEQEHAHRRARDAALAALPFPHSTFRAGQRELAVAVYRGARDKTCVLAQAPTGIGKTLATLFPALKACGDQGVDKVFFLAAKAPGRALAMQAMTQLSQALPEGSGVRVLDIVARDKVCEYPGRACHGDDCPLARGFYDRLPAARAQALAQPQIMGREHVGTIARHHGICPYYLSQELARWSDVLVGDYNYYFDASAMLYAMAQLHQWQVEVLVDEAHNLVERARAMYSATLSHSALDGARQAAPAPMKAPLDLLHKRWQAWARAQGPIDDNESLPESASLQVDPTDGLGQAIRQAVTALTERLDDTPQLDPAVMRFYFDAAYFVRLLDTFGTHSMFDVLDEAVPARSRRRTALAIRNVIPASFLAPRHAGARSVCLFSGTLLPQQFYADMLGLPAGTQRLAVASPFNATQLAVHINPDVSTRFHDRAASIDRLVQVIVSQMRERPGNYLAFFSSFDYLTQVQAKLVGQPGVALWAQSPGMDEQARAAFLARFVAGGQGLGLAVLGGAFGEGVDLPGDRLIGAFIATLGLPQVNPVNTRMMQKMEARFGQGYDYTYLYPGLQKVVQAAGRVIRSELDYGVVHLIDDRYAWRKIRALLPDWWRPVIVSPASAHPSTHPH
ncbi:MAG: ATP-dependent DNA helicase [Burkholderiaceae bacterium]